MAMHKLSVTIDAETAKALKSVPKRGVSNFVNEAIKAAVQREAERKHTRELLAFLEEELGPPDPQLMAEADEAFERAVRGKKKKAASKRRSRTR